MKGVVVGGGCSCAKLLKHVALVDQKESRGAGKQRDMGKPGSDHAGLVGFWPPALEHHRKVLATSLAPHRDSVQLNEWMDGRMNE